MLPPLAVDDSASVEIEAPSLSSRRTTETVTDPAFPEPGPRVSVEIKPSLRIARSPAVTETLPPLPAPAVAEKIPVPPAAGFAPEPSIVSWPDTATLMLPARPALARPGPNAEAEISPLLIIRKPPALML